MGHDLEKSKASVIAAALEELKGSRKDDGAEILAFAETLLQGAPPHDIAHETPSNLAGMAQAVWRFLQERKPGKPKVKVSKPSGATDGWSSDHTAVMIINDDMPFLVDSVTAELNREDRDVYLVIHPIFKIERDEQGKLLSIGSTDEETDGRRESVMLILTAEQADSEMPKIEEELQNVLSAVRLSVDDWRDMRRQCHDIIRELERDPPKVTRDEVFEAISFLEWVDEDHFTFLGYREYKFEGKGAKAVAKIDNKSGLGVLRDPAVSVFHGLRNLGQLPKDVQVWVKEPELLRVTKTNRRSKVHRPVHMDAIAIKTFDRKGNVTGERVFVGLFTSQAYSRSPRAIPLLRRKVDDCIAKAGFMPGSHDGKALLHILETYPRDELFQISIEELAEITIGVLNLQERQRTALFVRRDPFERFVSCMIYVPSDRFDTNLRLKLQAILAAAYQGEVTAFRTTLGDSNLARLHVTVRTEQGKVPQVDVLKLEEELAAAARQWTDRLQDALIETHGEREGLLLQRRYGQAFPSNYQESYHPKDAVADIRCIEQALATGRLAMDLYRAHGAPEQSLNFKIYSPNKSVPLSDVLPMLENMGLKVIGEVPFEIDASGGTTIWIQDFHMEMRSGETLEIEPIRAAFHEVFDLVWRGEMEDDGLNRLVVVASLTAEEIRILRAYCKYLRQAQIPFSQRYMQDTLANNAKITLALARLFMLRFHPDGHKREEAKSTKEAVERVELQILTLLEGVSNLDEDRIIRRYLNLIQNTLRTNYFQRANGVKSYVSFKFDARKLEDLPEPRPYREIFVYSPQVEGVHLRFGAVARGGLRWSDRREDFRTEILGLVKAQQVKNAVIVPVGSKGGFFPKRLPPMAAGREAWLAEGVASYRTFLRGLLDITDNIQNGKIVPPQDCVRYDKDDPYLVVAADKGTATFSDYANAISEDYGFWLGDAFASGGSAGYDHKVMGITARGGWESVKRHFREIGKDIQNEDFTVIGVGDMGGDVFGNGMLLSKQICLKAAFNHLHIFIDPEPDSAKTWVERKRLFDAVKGWGDYDAKLISKGGGVFDRKAKSIKITPEMKRAFAIEADSLTPNELIKALLVSDVELLWFGGIGTYIKAADESDAEVGDRANDAIRINGKQVRAKVVGEGANLGVTQRGRIEFGLNGGRLNTDAIDNSAGVDCSDHEVNIKILLGAVEQEGAMTRKQRDKLLEKMTEEVGHLVLRDNYMQTQSITVTHRLGVHLLDRLGRFMRSLERAGQLDRGLEFLPDEEVLAERLNAGIGLSRPELAVLLSYAKLVLYEDLLASDLPDDSYLVKDLIEYFPTPLRKSYRTQIEGHSLRREIIATVVTNEIINRMGIAFIHEVQERSGRPACDIARAYIVAREIFGLNDLWSGIEALDNKVAAQTQADMLLECGRLCERIVLWLLHYEIGHIDIAKLIKGYGPSVSSLLAEVGNLISKEANEVVSRDSGAFSTAGAPKALAVKVAGLKQLVPACDIVRLSQASKLPVLEAGDIYFRVGQRFGFDWLRRATGRLPSDSAWDKLAVSAIVDDLYAYQFQLVGKIIAAAQTAGKGDPLDIWSKERPAQTARSEQLISELQTMVSPDFAMIAVANRQLKTLVD